MATRSTLDELIKFLERQVTDEDDATASYRAFAGIADELGHHSIGATLRGIAEDEHKHSQLLGQIVRRLSWAPESAKLQRPYPQTYGQWADLGADIKETDPNLSDEVNDALCKIAAEEPGMDDAQRFLVNKAGELGIT